MQEWVSKYAADHKASPPANETTKPSETDKPRIAVLTDTVDELEMSLADAERRIEEKESLILEKEARSQQLLPLVKLDYAVVNRTVARYEGGQRDDIKASNALLHYGTAAAMCTLALDSLDEGREAPAKCFLEMYGVSPQTFRSFEGDKSFVEMIDMYGSVQIILRNNHQTV